MAFVMLIAFSMKHIFNLGPTALEVVILVSSTIAFVLAVWAAWNSHRDFLYRLRTDGNGKTEVAEDDASRDWTRVLASWMSIVGAYDVLHTAVNYTYEALVAKHCWMFLIWFLLATILRDRISRKRLLRSK